MSQILRAFSATVDDVNTKDRTIVSKVTVGDIDRHRTLILSRGVELDSYRKNPVVLFEHGKDPTRGMLPIGRCVWIKHDEVGNGRILAKTAFASDDFSSLLLDFYEQGTMRGWSIRAGFKDASPPSREEIRRRPELAECDTVYRSTTLYEYSAVSIPSCPTALSDPELRSLSTLVVRGFWTPSEEVKPLVDPIIERMAESGGMASGGALVADDDDDEEDEPDGDEDDESDVPPKKKKKKAKERSADDDSGDDGSIAMCAEKPEMRSADDAEAVAPEADAEAEADAIERDAPREAMEPVEDAPEPADDPAPEVRPASFWRNATHELVVNRRMDAERFDELTIAEIERLLSEPAPAVEATPEPEPEPAPVDPLAGLPPIVGRSLEDISRTHAVKVAAWEKSIKALFDEFEGYMRGEA